MCGRSIFACVFRRCGRFGGQLVPRLAAVARRMIRAALGHRGPVLVGRRQGGAAGASRLPGVMFPVVRKRWRLKTC